MQSLQEVEEIIKDVLQAGNRPRGAGDDSTESEIIHRLCR